MVCNELKNRFLKGVFSFNEFPPGGRYFALRPGFLKGLETWLRVGGIQSGGSAGWARCGVAGRLAEKSVGHPNPPELV